MSNLFADQTFVSSAGLPLRWKVECDAFTPSEWDWAANRIAERFPFCRVIAVPSKGVAGTRDNAAELASRLQSRVVANAERILIVDDVWTTGASIQRTLEQAAKDFGIPNLDVPELTVYAHVVFARGRLPHWAYCLWQWQGVGD